jgi:hypothetical protein
MGNWLLFQYLVVYNLALSGSGTVEISATRVSWDGSWKSSQFPIRHGPDDQRDPEVAYSDAHDEYLIVYWNSWASGKEDIAAQRVRASDGALLSWRTIATGANARAYPYPAYLAGRDEYLVVYEYGSGPLVLVRGSRFTYDMATVYSEIVISDPGSYAYAPRIAAGPDEYLVAWDMGPAIDVDARGRRLSGDGTPQGPSVGFDIAGAGSAGIYSAMDAAYLANFGYLVAVEHQPQNAGYDVLGRFVEPGNDAAAGDLFPLFDLPESQSNPRVACAPDAHCLIVELDNWDPVGLSRWAFRGLLLGPCPRVFLPLILRSH